MAWITLTIALRGQATPPEGDPPRFTVQGESSAVQSLGGNSGAGPERVVYESSVTLTGETSFLEEGVMTFDDGADRLRFTTLEQGFLAPSAEDGVVHGSVMWRVEGGEGRLAEASGLLVSNFTFTPSNGQVTEHQIAKLFLSGA